MIAPTDTATATEAADASGGERLRKNVQEYASRAFEAASRRERLSNWLTTGGSANAEIGRAGALLRERARYLGRNDPYASRVLDLCTSNIVGAGIKAQMREDSAIAKLWREWAESKACDADGLMNLYGQQRLITRAMAESGEVLIRRRFRRASDGLPVPMQLQVLEADHIDHSKDGYVADRPNHRLVQGVEFDGIGRRVAYWIHRVHPGEAGFQGATASVRVPAEDIIHLYEVERPGQVRGVTWLAPIIVRSHELRAYEDAQLLRQKIAACFAVFEQDNGMALDPAQLPASENTNDDGEVLGEDYVTPGLYKRLPPGKSVEFSNPPSVSGYSEFVSQQLRAISVGVGFSYEAVTGDLEGVSFSAGRMGHLETGRLVRIGQELLKESFCKTVWEWFRTAAALVGVGGDVVPQWIPPARDMIDPAKEVAAKKESVRAGFTSVSEVIRANGGDPDEVHADLARDIERMRNLGIVSDVDVASYEAVKSSSSDNASPEGGDDAPNGGRDDE